MKLINNYSNNIIAINIIIQLLATISHTNWYFLFINKKKQTIIIINFAGFLFIIYYDCLKFVLCSYTGTMNSSPSKLLRVCVWPTVQNKLNISWDLLPCHLQNGADITDYVIQYNRTFGGEAQNIYSSSSDNGVTCAKVSGGRYGCLIPEALFISASSYTFQVAAINRYGDGPFSDPVNTEIGVQSIL